MATMLPRDHVELIVRLVVTKETAGGLLGGISEVEVLTANGEVDGRFYGFADPTGRMVLNYKAGGRPPKPVREEKPAPKPLTTAQKAAIPANGTKGKPKAKAAAKPEAEAPSEMELMLERMLEKKLKEMLGG